MQTFSNPPMFQEALTVEEIVGPKMDMLRHHCSLSYKADDMEPALKSFTTQDRLYCAQLYEALRKNGYCINGFDSDNNIKFGIMLKSDIQMLMETNGEYYERIGQKIAETNGLKIPFLKMPD